MKMCDNCHDYIAYDNLSWNGDIEMWVCPDCYLADAEAKWVDNIGN